MITSSRLIELGFRSSLLFTHTGSDSPLRPHITIQTFSFVPASFCDPVETITNQRPLLLTVFSKVLGMPSIMSSRGVEGCKSNRNTYNLRVVNQNDHFIISHIYELSINVVVFIVVKQTRAITNCDEYTLYSCFDTENKANLHTSFR